jgi:hypothetical protein
MNLKTGEEVTPRSLFHMASITKPFVATSIVQLLEQKKLSLDDRIVEYLPYFDMKDERYATLTIRQCETFSVVIRIDDNLEKYLAVVKEGSIIKIGFKPDRSYDIGRVTTEAAITMPELTGVSLSGSAEDVSIHASGSSEVDLAAFRKKSRRRIDRCASYIEPSFHLEEYVEVSDQYSHCQQPHQGCRDDHRQTQRSYDHPSVGFFVRFK